MLTHSTSGRDISFTTSQIAAGATVTCQVTLTVDTNTGEKIENKAAISEIKNAHGYSVTNTNTATSSDYYSLRTYNVSVNKYIQAHDGTAVSPERSGYNNSQKQNKNRK